MSGHLPIENCNIIKDLLPLYVDGSLSEDGERFVSNHLANCSDCRKEYEFMEGDLNLEVKTEKITAPINNLKKIYFYRGLKGVLISVVAVLCVFGIVSGWILWPAFHGFTTFDSNNLSILHENGKILIIPDSSASNRQLHYIYKVNDDNTITMYFSFGTVRSQYRDALRWNEIKENVNWIIEPQTLIKSGEEISIEGGTYTDHGVSGSDYILDDMASITLPEYVEEVYYVSNMSDDIISNWNKCMKKNEEQLIESLSMDDAQTYSLVPTDGFDFDSIQDKIVLEENK
jgi:hypothetical protein